MFYTMPLDELELGCGVGAYQLARILMGRACAVDTGFKATDMLFHDRELAP